ncbi:MAG: hypothetical protein H5U40_12020, partial [Polyangiaceae bacterium]|nr:hypothetical protein [Polyangiaceae bacterium]
MSARLVFLLAALLLASGCVERQSAIEEEPVSLRELISREAPSPEHRLAIRFEDKVELVGYDLEPREPAPGDRLTITWHWKALRAIDPGFRLFTH